MSRNLAFAVLFAAACSAPSSPDAPRTGEFGTFVMAKEWRVVVGPASPEDRESLEEALAAWRREVPCEVSFVVEDGRAGGPDDPMPEPGTIEFSIGATPRGVGWTRYEGGAARIVVEPHGAEVRWDFPRVLRHELGHAFGMGHGGDGIMRDPPVADAAITREDAERFGRLWCPDAARSSWKE